MSEKSRNRSPYQGLIPFDEGDAPFFFGREKETRLISANLFASALTLLYGASGVGKSSVLRAGVAHQLRQRDDVLVVVFNAWQREPINDLKAAIAAAAKAVEPGFVPPSLSLSLADYLNAYSNKLQRHVMIILDQFEEYFLYHAQDDSFADEFARALLQSEPPSSFLISIREDFYAKLDRFEGRIPSLYDNYFRVEHLDLTAARAALEKPVAEFNRLQANGAPISLEPALVEAVLTQVQTGQVVLGESGRGSVATASSPGNGNAQIETPFLQLVMTRIWDEEMAEQSTTLRAATLERLGGAESIVRTHLDAVMNAQQPQDQDVASGIFHYLVTPSGTKIAYTASDLAEQAELDRARVITVLEKLSHGELRILRPVDPPIDQPTERRYEIFHDVLGPAVLSWCAAFVQRKRRAAAEQRALEQEQRANEQARIATRLRRLVAALIVMFVLSLGAVGVAVAQWSVAKRNERAALNNQRQAEENKLLAEKFRADGLKSEETAVRERRVAKIAEANAEEAKTVAGTERKAADDARDKAAQSEKTAAVALSGAREAKRQAEILLGNLNVSRLETQAQIKIRSLNDTLTLAASALHTSPEQSMWLSKKAVEDALKIPADADPPTAAAEDVLRRSLLELNESNVTAVMNSEDSVKSVAFSPNGRFAAILTADRKAYIADGRTGQKLRELEDLSFSAISISFSPDGTGILVSGIGDLGYWNVQTGKRVARVNGLRAGTFFASTSFLKDSNVVTVGQFNSLFFSKQPRYASLWRPLIPASSLEPLAPKIGLPNPSSWISRDGQLAVTTSGSAFEVWDISTRKILASNVVDIRNSHTGRVLSGDESADILLSRAEINLDDRFPKILVPLFAFSTDGKYVAYAGQGPGPAQAAIVKLNEPAPPSDSASTNPSQNSTAPPVKLEGFNGTVNSLTFSPDNKLLLTCSGADNTRIWNVESGTIVSDLPDHDEEVTDAIFSADGRFILEIMADGTIEVWSIQARTPFAVIRGHTGRIFDASFSPDGQSLITASFDMTARMWKWQPETWRTTPSTHINDVLKTRQPSFSQDGQLIFVASQSGAYVSKVGTGEQLTFPGYEAAFNPRKKLVATAAIENRTALSDLNGKVRGLLNVDPDSVERLSFSNLGNFVLLSSADGGTRVFDAITGKTLAAFEGKNAVFSPNDKLIATVDSNGVQIFDWKSDKSLREPIRLDATMAVGALKIAFNANSELLATGHYNGQVRIWSAATGKLIASLPPHERQEAIHTVAFSGDGKLVLSVEAYGAQVCEVPASGTPAGEVKCLNLTGHAPPARAAAFSADSKYVLTAGGNFVNVWLASATTQKKVAVLHQANYNAVSAAFSPDGKYVVSGGTHTLDVWTLPNPTAVEQVVESSVSYDSAQDSFASVAFTPDGKYVVGSAEDGKLYLWDWRDPKSSPLIKEGKPAVLSPDHQQVAMTAPTGVVQVWDTKTWDSGPRRRIAQFEGFPGEVRKLTFSPDGALIAAISSATPQAFVWSLATGKLTTSMTFAARESLGDLAFSFDASLLAIGHDDTISILDQAGTELRTLKGPKDPVTTIAFSPDGRFLAAGCEDGTVRIWEVATGKLQAFLRGHFDSVTSVMFSSDGSFVVSASTDKTARIWQWQNEEAPRSSLVLRGHSTAVQNAVFSLDGKFVLTTGDKETRLWNARTGQELAELVVPGDASGGASFSADSKSIVTAGRSGTYLYRCRECGSSSSLLEQVDELLKARPLLVNSRP